MMKVLGLTGPTGAGKGTVAAVFAELYGIPSIDTDAVYHELLIPPSPCLDELVTAFGAEILRRDGTLDRPALSRIVFSDLSGEKQKLLNGITHKYVLDETANRLEAFRKEGKIAAFVDAPLLYESGFDAACDAVIAVLAPRDIRRSRIISRDGLSAERADARLNMQKPDEFFRKKTDLILWNQGNVEDLKQQIRKIAVQLGVIGK